MGEVGVGVLWSRGPEVPPECLGSLKLPPAVCVCMCMCVCVLGRGG